MYSTNVWSLGNGLFKVCFPYLTPLALSFLYFRQWGFENEQDLAEEESFFGLANSSELAEVVRLSEAFDQCMQNFLNELDAKVHGRSRNMSTSVDFNDEDDFDFEQNESNFVSGDEQDVDSLRFLVHQLDYNHYYGLLHRS